MEYIDEKKESYKAKASKRVQLLSRIKGISSKAKELQLAIENDLIEFSESVGVDMSRVRAVMEQLYREA